MSETMFQIPYTDHEERLSVETKCTVCSSKHKEETGELKPIMTTQEYVVITPYAEGVDPMDLLKLAKRLVICKVCGTLRLTN